MRRILSVVGVAALLVVASGCDLFNWTQYNASGGNAGQVGASKIDSGSVSNLRAAWTVSSPNLSPAALAVVDDTVYASSAINSSTIIAQSVPPPLEAHSVVDGSLRWSLGGVTVETQGGFQCVVNSAGTAPVIVGGRYSFLAQSGFCVIGGSGQGGCADTTIDTATGTPGSASYDPNGCITSNPVAAADGTVYVVRTPNPALLPGPNGFGPTVIGSDGSIFVPPATTPAVASLSGPAVDNNSLYTVTDTGKLLAFDRSSHASLWATSVGTTFPAGTSLPTPSVFLGRVFVTAGSATEAFDATTGALLWSTPLPDAGSLEAPAVTSAQVFVRTGDTLVALDAATGAVQWEASLGTASGTVSSLGSPSIANDAVFVGTQDGRLLAFAASPTACAGPAPMCAPIWSATLSGATDSSRPAITRDAVYISAANGTAGSQLYKFGL